MNQDASSVQKQPHVTWTQHCKSTIPPLKNTFYFTLAINKIFLNNFKESNLIFSADLHPLMHHPLIQMFLTPNQGHHEKGRAPLTGLVFARLESSEPMEGRAGSQALSGTHWYIYGMWVQKSVKHISIKSNYGQGPIAEPSRWGRHGSCPQDMYHLRRKGKNTVHKGTLRRQLLCTGVC